MTTTFLVVSSLVKVLVVLVITVGTFAPIIRLPMWRLAALTGIVAVVALLTLTFVAIKGSNPLPLSTSALTATLVGFGAASVLLRVGYGVHGMIVRNSGKIMLLGLLHPLADAVKFIFKEDFVPPKADKLLFSAGPIIALIPAIAAFAVIPFASSLHWDYLNQVLPRTGEIAGPVVPMQVASINVGILFIFAIASTGIIGAAVAGYASDNKYSLLGGIRAASQMVSYEVVLGLTLVPAFMVYASLRLEDMAMWQYDHMWGIFVPPLTLAAINFFVAAVAETKRVPFDLPEGESELVGGYLTEYSGMKFGMFFMGEFVEVVSLAALASVIFLGGWDVPFLYRDGFEFSLPFVSAGFSVPLVHWLVVAIQFVVFLFKIIVLIWFQLMIRWSLPRFRYDQLMSLCWKGLLPVSLLNILVIGAFILSGWLDGWVAFFEKLF